VRNGMPAAAVMLAPALRSRCGCDAYSSYLHCNCVCAGSFSIISSRARSRTRSARSQILGICARPCTGCVRMRERGRMLIAAAIVAPALRAHALCNCVVHDVIRGLLHHTPRTCLNRHLNANQLTGAIPDSLGSLAFLGSLCVPVRGLCAHEKARAHGSCSGEGAPALMYAPHAPTRSIAFAGTSPTISSRARSRTRSAHSHAFNNCAPSCAGCVRMRERGTASHAVAARCSLPIGSLKRC
jgi:hypothetical protein